MTTHLVIGDAHAKPGVSNERFSMLGEWVVKHRPDVIIDMGDWADMPSLSSYDKGKRSFEGRRYTRDIEAARDARAAFNRPIDNFNQQQRRNGKRLYRPRKVALGGNHDEGRINRATNSTPELHGTISVADLGYAEYGWEYVPFLVPVCIDGVTYSHYFTSGVKGKAISGEHPATSLLTKKFRSCTSGHLHLRDFAERTTVGGRKILGLFTGCFFDHHEEWAGDANELYWRGVILCKDVVDGYYNPNFIDFDELRRG
jgi:hypothetical protein